MSQKHLVLPANKLFFIFPLLILSFAPPISYALPLTTVPVKVTVTNNNWVQTITLCNNSSWTVPLSNLNFSFHYAVAMPTNIWGNPWLNWQVSSQTNNTVTLKGGSPYVPVLQPDPTCAKPITIQFNAAPTLPQPQGPFILQAEGARSTNPANLEDDIKRVQIRIGPPKTTLGPVPDKVDALFNSIKLENGNYLCTTANATTYAMTGTKPLCTGSQLTPILKPVNNDYANCGLWVNDLNRDPSDASHLYAFVHAEQDCNYNQGTTHKSMAVAQSFDAGKTWTLEGQIIAGSELPTPGKTTGEGDCSTVADDNYYYIYCYRNTDYKTIVARAPRSLPPLSGTWQKYFNGSWSSPGLGGNATSINAYGAASRWLEKDYIMLTSIPSGNSGVVTYFSADRINFITLPDPLLMSDNSTWHRTPDATELIAYVAVVSSLGERQWEKGHFTLTHMYLEPGADYGSRYLVNRDVILTLSTTKNEAGEKPQVGVELSRWLHNNKPEIISTTAPVIGPFTYNKKLGYMMTRQLTGTNAPATVKIEECIGYWSNYVDHVVTPDGVCAPGGYKRLRTLGWLYQDEQPNTTALYRCWSPKTYGSHFVSLDPNCEGETFEYRLGYILTN
ncbi:Uncharacterised protein [Legionella beliardensis]|uniref:Uncharacterized protein n=1 Tax=Legionella beliardensis TaxID=91822 RepID=A0A378I0W4_9GAMM|nr:hypothetical protein [Legionella beliardensis]STX28847.1 Uncharacterised protein [Legionella beliardensis]